MSQDLRGWERVIPEDGQKNGRFKERATEEQNMRFGPHHKRLRMETRAVKEKHRIVCKTGGR